MQRSLVILFLMCLGSIPSSICAQQPAPDTTDASDGVEAALQQSDAATTSEALAEWLAERADDPLNLNTASADILSRLPGLTPLLADRIVAHRTTHGPYASRSELLSIGGFSDEVFRTIRPFVFAAAISSSRDRRPMLQRLEGRLIQRVTRRIDTGRGYASDSSRTTYTGNPIRWYTRLQLRSARQLEFNLTMEKDPGEAFLWQPSTRTYGFDHISTHLTFHDLGPVETLVIGDYNVAFGQGAALWRSFSFSKGRDVVAPAARRGSGLSSYGSAEENRFFRGAGATMRLHARLSLTAFGSHRSLDATLTVDEQRGLIPTSLATSGLHRTPNERAKKDAIQETIAGGALEWTQPGLHVGLAGYRGRFAQPLISGSAPYQRFDFAGRTHAVVTAYANATLGSMYAFGELARSEVAWGGIGGVLIDEENADAVVSLRYFPRHFTAPHGQIFGERGDPPQNETGAYIGLRVRPAPKWQLSGYVDQYVFPWLRFAIPRPSTGRDVRFLVEHTPRSWLNYYLQVRTEIREEGTTIETADSRILESLHAAPRQSIRLHGEYAFSPRLRFRMRIEGARHTASDASHTGVLLYQGARWRPASWLRFDTRWTLFDTDGFDARIYTYEHDLLYTFSIPVFSGRGQRYYTLLQLTPMDGLHLELKYGTTRYRDVAAVGSGLDEVEGQRIREVRMQVRWSF